MMHRTVMLALAMVALGAAFASAAPLPSRVGACSVTTVKRIESRLEGMPNSGSAIVYDNGGYQVSYDTIPAMKAPRPGDAVKLCLTYIPHPCPPGDVRGRVYRATNLRTGEHWSAADAEHGCGGA
jgi:hypothetical protein